MLDHPTEAARMATAARTHIGDQSQPQNLGQELMHIYDHALGVRLA
jgi:hypothetical protein